MNNTELNQLVSESISEAEEVTGYEMTEKDLEYSKDMIAKISKYYMKKDADKTRKIKIKNQRRNANKMAKKSRRTNRK